MEKAAAGAASGFSDDDGNQMELLANNEEGIADLASHANTKQQTSQEIKAETSQGIIDKSQ